MSGRANILLITADQLRADHLGCYGNRVVRTPHIDALSARGRRYDRAYVACPVCMPNRASLMTGRMPSLHGVRHNGLNLSLDSTTLPELLRRDGYRTGLSGKAHFQCVTGAPPLMRGGPTQEACAPGPGRYDQELAPRWQAGEGRLDLPYYGFEQVDLAIGHGDEVEGDYTAWAAGRGVDVRARRGPQAALPGAERALFQAWRTAIPEEVHPTRYVQETTIAALAGHAQDPARPFFHWASFSDPHHPFTPPGRYWNMYDPAEVDLPESCCAMQRPERVAKVHEARREGRANPQGTAAIAVTQAEARAAIALTYGMVSMIDDAVGAILAALEAQGLADNTIVIFLSDHGDLMGDHGLIFKGPFHYDGVIRMPLIWHDPHHPDPGCCDALLSAVDLPATILQATGVAPFNGLSGRPFLTREGAALPGREAVLIEDEIQSHLPGTGLRGRARTLITRRWRLTIHDGLETGELIDLENDPQEARNLWHAPEATAIRAELTERLLREIIALSETSPLPEFAA